jgi:hypothetical protein
MAMPSAFVRETELQGTAEAFQQEVKEAERESGTGMTVGRRREP